MERLREIDQKRKKTAYMQMSRDNNKKRKNLLLWKCHVAMTDKKRKKTTISSS